MRYLLMLSLSVLLAMPAPLWAAKQQRAEETEILKLHSPATQGAVSQKQERADIRDIKGPLPLDEGTPSLPYVGAALIALCLISALLFWWWKRRTTPPEPVQQPGEQALAALATAERLLTEGELLAYAEQISTILRHYIEQRFAIHSTRQTTREFFTSLERGNTATTIALQMHKKQLQHCLEQCDMAKFAHMPPSRDMMQQAGQAIRTFITATQMVHAEQGETV